MRTIQLSFPRFTLPYSLIALYLFTSLCFFSCQQTEDPTESIYECQTTVPDLSSHPKAAQYQDILEEQVATGLPGAVILVKDNEGVWQGAAGKASLELNVDLEPCHRMLVASISKVFTGVVIHKLVDEGKLSLSDQMSKWMDAEVIDQLENADQVDISMLLAHTAGLADYYQIAYELDRFNKVDNEWRQEDVLKYCYGKKATHAPGETYAYSNTNYLVLGMIAEAASGESLEELYDRIIFAPLALSSAYYSGFENPIPAGTAAGYGEIYKDKLVSSEFLYKDELKMADGGIAINAWDLSRFIEAIWKGEILSPESRAAMMDFFELPDDYKGDVLGEDQNGYGIEVFQTSKGLAIGHTGAVDGFLSIMMYFPDTDRTYISLVNAASFNFEAREKMFTETLDLMFE